MTSYLRHVVMTFPLVLILISTDCKRINNDVIEARINHEILLGGKNHSTTSGISYRDVIVKNNSQIHSTRYDQRKVTYRGDLIQRFIQSRNYLPRQFHQSIDESSNQHSINHLDRRTTDRSSQVKLLMMALEKLEKMSKHLIQLSRKLSSRSMKNFRILKTNFKKMSSFLNQSRNNSVVGSRAHNSISEDHNTSKIPGIKRSAHEDSFLCPSEFVGVGSWTSCYRFSTLQATWNEARSYCNFLGADLLSMETLKEAYIVDYLIKSHGASSRTGPQHKLDNRLHHLKSQNHHPNIYDPSIFTDDLNYWTSAIRTSEGNNWTWSSRTEVKPMTFSRWQSGRPDSLYLKRCMIINGSIGSTWSNVYCNAEYKFICEVNV